MVSAVSAVISQTPTSAGQREQASYHWFKMPDLNRATHRRLGQTAAGWTFETICRLVHHVGRVGRPQAAKAAKDLGRLGVGLQAIADEAGISVAKVKRDLVHLVDLGLVAVIRRHVTFTTDPATGKIVENRTGRSLPVVVHLTIGPEHGRTKASQDRAANPPRMAPANQATVAGPRMPDRDHPGGAIQRESNTKRTSGGLTDGIGQPQPGGQEGTLEPAGLPACNEPAAGTERREDAPQSRQRAAGEPGLPAGKAGHEGVAVRVDVGCDDLPVPIGRVSRPAGKKPAPERGNRRPFHEDHREPATWSGSAEAARLQMLAEMARRREQDDQASRAEQAAEGMTPRQRAMLARG